ncbi:MAG TPA: MoaD/ThiS family protein [Armatimonadota bacterium]|jgi:molybdopterin converting factor subunit 1
MTIQVGYYASFREQSGLSRESIETRVATASELFDELRIRHGFTLPMEAVRVAINREFRQMDARLADGDEVVFIPPVAGG